MGWRQLAEQALEFLRYENLPPDQGEGRAGGRTAQQAREAPHYVVEALDGQTDPLAHIRRTYSHGPGGRTRMFLGAQRGPAGVEFVYSEPESNVLVLGPPRSAKTTGVLAPQVLSHIGPRVVMSAKTDLAELCAVACARDGTVWHMDITGTDPLPGLRPARLSFISGASTWGKSKKLGSTILAAGAPAVFSRPDGSQLRAHHVQNAWTTARRKVGREDVHFHDLRHASLTLTAQLGATTAEVMRRAGHASARAAQMYQHAAESRDAEIAHRLSGLTGTPRARGDRQGGA